MPHLGLESEYGDEKKVWVCVREIGNMISFFHTDLFAKVRMDPSASTS